MRVMRAQMPKRYFYDCACDGLVNAIRTASRRDWQPYIGDTLVYALAQLKHVMRQGRALGLIPTRDEMEQAA
jgi:hypothetical protein